MTKNTGRLDELFALHLNQSATEIEQEEFWGYVNDPMYGREVKELVATLFSESDNLSMISEDERTVILAEVFSSQRTPVLISPPVIHKLNFWPRLAGIAAAIVFIVAGVYFFKPQPKPVRESQYARDIAPGKVGATLTLANGKKIRLADVVNGEIAMEAGTKVTKTENGELIYEIKGNSADENTINTLSTAKGETYTLTLPDKSKVWLNAASSLTYSANLTERGKRRVKLEGEGYFEIAKDKNHPFVVESGNQEVEVLGTHFNVNAYRDEKVYRTTLLEGSVKVSGHGEMKILVPGHQALNSGGHIKLSKVDTELAVAWKSNNFIFDRLDIKEIMRNIERWYNVEVIYKEEIPSGTFWGSVSRFENISKVLIPLEATGNVHFEIEGRKIYVFR